MPACEGTRFRPSNATVAAAAALHCIFAHQCQRSFRGCVCMVRRPLECAWLPPLSSRPPLSLTSITTHILIRINSNVVATGVHCVHLNRMWKPPLPSVKSSTVVHSMSLAKSSSDLIEGARRIYSTTKKLAAVRTFPLAHTQRHAHEHLRAHPPHALWLLGGS